MCPAQACLGQASPRKAWPAEAGFQGGEPANKDDCTQRAIQNTLSCVVFMHLAITLPLKRMFQLWMTNLCVYRYDV